MAGRNLLSGQPASQSGGADKGRNLLSEDRQQLAIWRGEASPYPEEGPAEGMDYASGLASQTLQGATASWGDEILSAAVTGLVRAGDAVGIEGLNVQEGESIMDTYHRIKASMRERDKNFRQDYPAASTTANVVGGMIPLSKGMSVAQEGISGVGKMMGVGAGYGLADYLGELENFSDAEIADAATRAGLGAAIPAGIAGGKGLWHWLRRREKDDVAAILDELIQRTGKTGDEIQQRAANMGPDTSLIDATDAVGIGYGQAARGMGAMDVTGTMERNIWPKLAMAKDKIRSTLKSLTGKGEQEYYDDLNSLIATRRARANKLYGDAIDRGVVRPTDRMVSILNDNPSVKDAYQRVAQRWARRGQQVPEMFNIDENTGKVINVWRGGKNVTETVPNMRFLQEMKFELDAMSNTMRGSTDSAGKLAYSRLLQDKNEFLDEIYKQNPSFKKANEAFAGDMALEGAQQMGRRHGLGRGNVDDQLEFIGTLNKSEKEAYLAGLMSDVYNTLGKSGTGVRGDEMLGNLNALTSQNAQKVLTKLIGKAKTRKLMETIQTQKRFKEVDTKLLQGSETAPRQAAVESLEKRNRLFNVEDMKRTSPKSMAIDKMISMLPSKYGKLDRNQMIELVDLMTKPNGVQMAIDRAKQAGYNPYIIGEIARYLSAGGVAASGSQQQDNEGLWE